MSLIHPLVLDDLNFPQFCMPLLRDSSSFMTWGGETLQLKSSFSSWKVNERFSYFKRRSRQYLIVGSHITVCKSAHLRGNLAFAVYFFQEFRNSSLAIMQWNISTICTRLPARMYTVSWYIRVSLVGSTCRAFSISSIPSILFDCGKNPFNNWNCSEKALNLSNSISLCCFSLMNWWYSSAPINVSTCFKWFSITLKSYLVTSPLATSWYICCSFFWAELHILIHSVDKPLLAFDVELLNLISSDHKSDDKSSLRGTSTAKTDIWSQLTGAVFKNMWSTILPAQM